MFLLLIQWSRIQKLCHLSFNEVPSSPCYVALWYVHLCIAACSKQFLGQASFSFQWLSFLQHLERWGHGFPSVDKFVQTKMKVILLSIVNSQQRLDSIPSLWLIWMQQHSWAMAPVSMVCFKISSVFSGFQWISGTVLDLEDDRIDAKCWFLTVLIFFSALAFTGFLNIKHLMLLVWLFSPFLLQKYAPTQSGLWDFAGNSLMS